VTAIVRFLAAQFKNLFYICAAYILYKSEEKEIDREMFFSPSYTYIYYFELYDKTIPNDRYTRNLSFIITM